MTPTAWFVPCRFALEFAWALAVVVLTRRGAQKRDFDATAPVFAATAEPEPATVGVELSVGESGEVCVHVFDLALGPAEEEEEQDLEAIWVQLNFELYKVGSRSLLQMGARRTPVFFAAACSLRARRARRAGRIVLTMNAWSQDEVVANLLPTEDGGVVLHLLPQESVRAHLAVMTRGEARAAEALAMQTAAVRAAAEYQLAWAAAQADDQRDGPGHPGRLSTLGVFHSKLVLYGAFVRARSVLNIPKRRYPARAAADRARLDQEEEAELARIDALDPAGEELEVIQYAKYIGIDPVCYETTANV